MIMQYNKSLFRFALFTAVSTGLLIVAGALVTSTQSGLSVPDWPNTYGHFMFSFPLTKMVGGILYEHGHRMIASVVGFFILVLAVWLWRREGRRWVRTLGFIALGGVVLQGLLGGLTVLLYLPAPISASHATLAQTVFSLVCSIALFTSRWWLGETSRIAEPGTSPSLFNLAILATIAVYFQLIIGAIMRHTESGLVIPDFPLAFGQLFPSLSQESLGRYTEQLRMMELRRFIDGPVGADQIFIHMLHRFWALVAGGAVVWTAFRLIRQAALSDRLARIGFLLIVQVVTQILLGALTVLTHKNVEMTTAHVASGALLLVTMVITTLHVGRLYGARYVLRSAPINPKQTMA